MDQPQPARALAALLIAASLALGVACDGGTSSSADAALPRVPEVPEDAERFPLDAHSAVAVVSAEGVPAPVVRLGGGIALTDGTAEGAVLELTFEADGDGPGSFRSTSIRRDGDGLRVEGILEWDGRRRAVAFPAEIYVGERQVTAHGEVPLPDERRLRLHLEASASTG